MRFRNTLLFTVIAALGAPPSLVWARSAPEATPVSIAARLAAARTRLDTLLGALETAPSREHLAEVHRAMDEIREGLAVYFHGRFPGDAAGQAAWNTLRGEVMRLLGGGRPLVVVAHDVLRFHPTVHRHLARVSQQVGEFRRAVEHLRAVQAMEGPTSADLEAIVAAFRAAGDPHGEAAALEELRAMRPPATTTGFP